ncbi:MAG: hypothetical protein CMJ76_16285 [Planctomycetaceae bacterium]|nr:hypothetical protein [Planctomycetaceae bacterium]
MHIIRLRGPWQYTPIATTRWTKNQQSEETGTEVPKPGTMKIPCDWADSLGPDFRGKVLFQRHFHKPSGLDENDTVRIYIEQVNALADIFLNHEAIGSASVEEGSTFFPIEDKLEQYNLLEIIVDFPLVNDQSGQLVTNEDLSGGITGEIQLEIVTADPSD